MHHVPATSIHTQSLPSTDLRSVDQHFAFGENWADFSCGINQDRIDQALAELTRLLAPRGLNKMRFLDIGSGSGIHSVAAAKLGATEIMALDLDPNSVATTKTVCAKFIPTTPLVALQQSVFDIDPETIGVFDVVYSWGVLHHTGAMFDAIKKASSVVAPNGRLVIALYRKTWLCPLWVLEKRWYSRASPAAQKFAQAVYATVFKVGLALRGRSFAKYVAEYAKNRGMDFQHDAHDWLGGYPYESINQTQLDAFMRTLGFVSAVNFTRKGGFLGRHIGAGGSGCDEYVYTKKP